MQWRHRAHNAANLSNASANHKALSPSVLPATFKQETKMTSRPTPATSKLRSKINIESNTPLEIPRATHHYILRLAILSAQDFNAHYLHQLQVSFRTYGT
jgi:hypothetical protein